MSRILFVLSRPRLWTMVSLPLLAFLALAWGTDDRTLILVLNMVQIALATNVVVAFAPAVIRIVCDTGRIDKVSTLILGIWVSWAAVVYRTGESLIWRLLGQPSWLINSDITSAYLALGCLGAICHVAMPDALNEDVPPRRWVQIGAVMGLAIFIGLVVVYADEIGAAWRGEPHDRHGGVKANLLLDR